MNGWDIDALLEMSESSLKEEEQEDTGERTKCVLKEKFHSGGGWCANPTDCDRCPYFNKYYPTSTWICSMCRTATEEEVMDYYSSGVCALCDEESMFLQPIKPPLARP